MNSEMPATWFARDAETTAKPFGNLVPPRAALTETSLEQLLIEVFRLCQSRPMRIEPTHMQFRQPSHLMWHLPGSRYWLVSRTLVVDWLVSSRSIRGWSLRAEYARVDCRRARRIQRRIRELSPVRSARNAAIRNNRIG